MSAETQELKVVSGDTGVISLDEATESAVQAATDRLVDEAVAALAGVPGVEITVIEGDDQDAEVSTEVSTEVGTEASDASWFADLDPAHPEPIFRKLTAAGLPLGYREGSWV